ncbi:MAG TPA: hypothetical protein PLK63_10355 [Catalimonadaceae bacterium]|nr:hypothetical protein [Catalimonadaceae bacterium]
MKKAFTLFHAMCLCLLLSTCTKDKQELPPITSRGANTFGCLVNGEPIVFTDIKKMSGGFIIQSDTSFGSLPYDSCDIWIYMENNTHSVNLFLNNPMEKSSWNLNQTTLGFPQRILPKDYIFIDNKKTSEYTKGFFKSENLRNTGPVFSGTFEFECVYPKTCQTLKVTNGRLDINLNQLQK